MTYSLDDLELIRSNLLGDADKFLTLDLDSIPSRLYVPYYYKDTEGHRKNIQLLEDHTKALTCLGYAFLETKNKKYLSKYIEIFYKWSQVIPSKKGDTPLSFVTRCYNMVKSYTMLKCYIKSDDRHDDILKWITYEYIPKAKFLAKSFVHKWNNHGTWGYCGWILGLHAIYGNVSLSPVFVKVELMDHFNFCSSNIPKISNPNELWIENLRTNSGMYYTYFNLAPILDLVTMNYISIDIKPYIEKLFQYTINPDTWNYKPTKIYGLKQLQKLIFPYSKEVRVLEPQEKGGYFFALAGLYYNREDWKQWAGKYRNPDAYGPFLYGDYHREFILKNKI